ncbi:NUDIX hydrolase [Candidatus Uabimicrobium sp. HlEnr_7]|uniref:NUDIX hydrolase n=1 Tax=Candidatus Uabimicrobium helgolandensis TaxID=3095367 RepID=UPI0035593271
MSEVSLCHSCSWQEFLDFLGKETSTLLNQGTKTSEDLFLELQEGESILTKKDNALFRKVSIAKMRIAHPSEQLVLMETAQFLPKKKIWRHRAILPSEKLQQGESAEQAAIRGLKEELEFTCRDHYKITLLGDEHSEGLSSSYNNLKTRYYAVTFLVIITKNLFKDKYTIEEKDGKISVFEWQREE